MLDAKTVEALHYVQTRSAEGKTDFEFTNFGLSDGGLASVINHLRLNPKITTKALNLFSCTLGVEASKELAIFISHTTALRSLGIAGTGVREEEFKLLCNALKVNTTVTNFNVTYCDPRLDKCRFFRTPHLLDVFKLNHALMHVPNFGIMENGKQVSITYTNRKYANSVFSVLSIKDGKVEIPETLGREDAIKILTGASSAILSLAETLKMENADRIKIALEDWAHELLSKEGGFAKVVLNSRNGADISKY